MRFCEMLKATVSQEQGVFTSCCHHCCPWLVSQLWSWAVVGIVLNINYCPQNKLNLPTYCRQFLSDKTCRSPKSLSHSESNCLIQRNQRKIHSTLFYSFENPTLKQLQQRKLLTLPQGDQLPAGLRPQEVPKVGTLGGNKDSTPPVLLGKHGTPKAAWFQNYTT